MAYDFQVTVDCADPHVLADWWARALGWTFEASDEAFIRSMVEQGFAAESETTTYQGVLVWATGQAIRHPEPLPSGRPRRVLFTKVPEAKAAKNRVHLDLWVGPDDVDEVVARLVSEGALELYRERQGPHSWVTMADPEDNEFCVSAG